jgi:hypothetical protein
MPVSPNRLDYCTRPCKNSALSGLQFRHLSFIHNVSRLRLSLAPGWELLDP